MMNTKAAADIEGTGDSVGLKVVQDPSLPEMDHSYAVAYSDRYERSGDLEDLEAALKYSISAVFATPVGDPDLAERHQNLAILYTDRYQRTGDLEDLEAALKYDVSAVAATPEGDPDLADRHHNLAISYTDRYQRTGDLDDLEAALKYNLSAVAATPEGHPDLAKKHQSLAISYNSRYQRTGDLDNLEAALRHNLSAMGTTPEGHADLARIYQNLAVCYGDRYQGTGNPEDLEAALKYGLSAVNATPEGHPDLAEGHQSLGVSYTDRYQRTGNLEDLEAALQYKLFAVAATPEGHPGLAGRQQSLAVSYIERYQKTRTLRDLETALKYNLSAMAATPEDHPDLARRHQSLAISYTNRYQRTGDLEDLDAGLKHNLSAVAITPESHPEYAGRHQSLAVSYTDRYRRIGDLKDLNAAIGYNLSAVAATPEVHPELAWRYQSLAACYTDRYQGTGDLSDLEAALKYDLSAVAATPEGHPELAWRHQSLGVSYTDRYRRIEDQKDLDSAIRYNLLAMAATPAGHSDLPGIHQNVAVCYSIRYHGTRNQHDLEAALRYSLSAVAATPEGHPDLPGRQQILAVSYTDRFQKTKDLEDLEAALRYNLSSVAATPKDHPNLPTMEKNLAQSFLLKYRNTEDTQYLSNANNLYKSALKSVTASPQTLWDVSVTFAYEGDIFSPTDRLEAYTTAFNVFPSLLWLGSSLGNRHNTLIRNDVSSFVSKAVAFALEASQPTIAVEFLEQGLSTTHKQKLQLKDDYAILQAYLPALSQRFKQVSVQLQDSSHKSDSTINYHSLAHERQQLISNIRKCSGFEHFLLPPSYLDLSSAAKNGPVILLNSTSTQTDIILIIKPHLPPSHLLLPNLKPDDIQEHQKMLRNALEILHIPSRNHRDGNTPEVYIDPKPAFELLRTVTHWLWTSTVKPVFEVLAKNGIYGGRLWWCPSGSFTYLPLHAAAPAKSRFIQSYIPTLDILIHANSNQISRRGNDFLTSVGVSKTLVIPPEGIWPEIHSVESELKTVVKLFGDQSQQLHGPQASITSVIEAMQSSSWLHLACHGEQVPADPLQSGLILYEEKLSLGQILNIDLPKAKFVYLSACETAMGDGQLANEAMHLAGGFLSAGFQGAIGTLWSMMDTDGPKVAEMVYQKILGEKNVPDVKMAAEGLHLAIQKLRQAGAPRYRWMPFVHFGV